MYRTLVVTFGDGRVCSNLDKFSTEKRSSIMSSVKSKNTRPEVMVRSMLHKRGLRFRLHSKDLPGSPDIVLPKYKTVIFVNGCFWHGHDCPKSRRPASNQSFWDEKLNKNIERDKANYALLKELGWDVKIIWECSVQNTTTEIINGLLHC